MNHTTFFNIRLDHTLLWIALLVTAIHLGLFFSIVLWDNEHKKLSLSDSKRLVVQTIKLQNAAPIPVTIQTVPEITSLPSFEPETPQKEDLSTSTPPSPTLDPVSELEQQSPSLTPEPEPISTPQPDPKLKPAYKPKPVKPRQVKSTPKQTATKPKLQKKADAASKKIVKKATKKEGKTLGKGEATSKAGKSETTSKAKEKKAVIDVRKQALLAEAQKSIAKMNSSSVKLIASSESAVLPAKIEALSVETLSSDGSAFTSFEEGTYNNTLAQRLKLLLRLPEYGEVKIELTLERTGKFINMVVVQTESKANRAYLEKSLPKLKYPNFQDSFPDESQHTFFITVSNDL